MNFGLQPGGRDITTGAATVIDGATHEPMKSSARHCRGYAVNSHQRPYPSPFPDADGVCLGLSRFPAAIGIIWIVLVPAEMLGVASGIGYFILDTRDRLAYDELMATIAVIGILGYSLDAAARVGYRFWTRDPAST